ncbi:MAG: hypothetical protein Tsb009_19910 [Planctomycetaceae bacterium]
MSTTLFSPLRPEDLMVDKLRSISSQYYENYKTEANPNAKRNEALEEITRKIPDGNGGEKDRPREDYINFYKEGEGKYIWEEFLTEVAQKKTGRDFEKLGPSEAEKLEEFLNLAFGHVIQNETQINTDYQDRSEPKGNKENEDVSEQPEERGNEKEEGEKTVSSNSEQDKLPKNGNPPFEKSNFAKYWGKVRPAVLWLVGIAAKVIAPVLWMVGISSKGTEYKQAQDSRLRTTFWLITSGFMVIGFTYYGLPELADVLAKNKTEPIEKQLKDTANSVKNLFDSDQYKQVQSHVKLVNSYVNTAKAQQSQGLTKIDQLTENTSEIRDNLDLLEKRSNNVKTILGKLDTWIKGTSNGQDAQNFITVRNQAFQTAKKLELAEKKPAEVKAELLKAFQPLEKLMPVTLDPDQKRILTEIQQEFAPVRNLAMGMNSISKDVGTDLKSIFVPKPMESDSQFKKDVDQLKKDMTASKNAAQSIESLLTQDRSGNKTDLSIYQTTNKALTKIQTAGEKAEDVGKVLNELTFRGTAPAVYLLFAIGAMFITFGISSLRAWSKGCDLRRDQVEWDRKVQMYSRLATGLIAQGIDPGRLINLLQGLNVQEAARPPLKTSTPISMTLSELLSTIKK